jgi:pyruvate/2-oxoglutarate dehydrogenase complex dihydrolipoamide dehydrogenase (E3) component
MPATSERIGPYLEQLLDDDDVQANVRRAVARAEQAVSRARNRKNAKEAVKDPGVRHRVQQSVVAARDAIVAIGRGPEIQRAKERRRLRRRRRNRLLGVAALAGGAFAAYKASTPPDKEHANV